MLISRRGKSVTAADVGRPARGGAVGGGGDGRQVRREPVDGRLEVLERRRTRRREVAVDPARSVRLSGRRGRRRRRLRRRDELVASSNGRQIPDQPSASIFRAKYDHLYVSYDGLQCQFFVTINVNKYAADVIAMWTKIMLLEFFKKSPKIAGI